MQLSLNEIYNEDCLDGMKRIEAGSVDMVLCDLPYESTANAWDQRIPFEPLWEQYKRITKPNAAIVLFSQLPFGAELIMSNWKMYRYEWIWEKNLAVGFLNSHKMPLRAHENILVFYRKLPTYNPQMTEGKPYVKVRKAEQFTKNYSGKCIKKEWIGINKGTRYPRDVLKYHTPYTSTKERGKHPTQKPVKLLEYLIKTYTNEGELVLDNCIGSGSTAVAAINTNRNFIGFETDAHYCEVAKQRIKEMRNRLTGQVNMQD